MGYALKKIGKLVAITLGVAFICLELLAYYGIININYAVLQEWANGVIGQVGIAEGVLTIIIGNLPFATIFLAGFALGLKIG